MRVTPLFDNDVDTEVALKQHGVYSEALGIMVSRCNQYAEFARRVLDDADHPEWGTVSSFDHEDFSTLTTFSPRFGAFGTTFDSQGCRSYVRDPLMTFRHSGLTGCAARFQGGSTVRSASAWFS